MRVTFVNASSYVVVVEHKNNPSFEVQPQTSLSDVKIRSLRSTLRLYHLEAPTGSTKAEDSEGKLASHRGLGSKLTGLRLSACKTWSSLSVPPQSRIRMYHIRVSRKRRKVLILDRRDTASFLSEIPDSTHLSSILLPGTHQTMSFYGWPVSQCQVAATPLQTQLRGGIRVIDVRLAMKGSNLIAQHGILPQKTPFMEMLSDIHSFLTSSESQRETVIMSIKQEDYVQTSQADFSAAVLREITSAPGGLGMWFLENRIPNLGEIRGKCVLFSRFGHSKGWQNGLEGMGIHPSTWPDSAKSGFTWNCKNTLVVTSDWYDIGSFLSIPEKSSLAAQNLVVVNDPPMPVLPISFFSASAFPLALPSLVARGSGWPEVGMGIEGVNSKLGGWLIETLSSDCQSLGGEDETSAYNEKLRQHTGASSDPEPATEIPIPPPEARMKGWALLDYYSSPEAGDLVPLLIEANFSSRSAIAWT